MILEKKWERKGRELSTKNYNFFYKNYLSSRRLFSGIIFLEVKTFEEHQKDLKLEALREAMRLALEELATSQKVNELAATENTENPTEQISDIPEQDKNSTAEQPNAVSTDDNGEVLTAEKIIADELAAEKIVILEHEHTLKRLRWTETKILLKDYRQLFVDFNISQKLEETLEDYSSIEELVDVKFLEKLKPRITLETLKTLEISLINLPKVFDILYFQKILNLKLNIFKKFKKIKRSKWKFKKRKLRKLYMLRKIKRAVVFKKFKKRAHSVYFNLSTYAIQHVSGSYNLLVRRMPVSERVIIATNLELFYKMNKRLKEEIVSLSKDYQSTSYELEPDLLIYLRNYHQKPY